MNIKNKINHNISRAMESIWHKISVNQFAEIRRTIISKKSEENKMIYMASILSGKSVKEVEQLPLSEASALFAQVQRLGVKPEPAKVKKMYKFGAWELVRSGREFNVAQWADFQTFAKDIENNINQIVSVVLIPKGKQYNNGYDIKQLQEDIGEQMSVADALAVCFFFRTLWQKQMLNILRYFIGWTTIARKKILREVAMRTYKRASATRS